MIQKEVLSTSPDGRFVVLTEPWEARNSLWIYPPEIQEISTARTVFCFKDSRWSVDSSEWLDETRVCLELRKYPGNNLAHSVQIVIDLANGVAMVKNSRTDPFYRRWLFRLRGAEAVQQAQIGVLQLEDFSIGYRYRRCTLIG